MDQQIYVIASSPNGPVKIGRSKHPQKRLRSLQTGHSEVLKVFHYEDTLGYPAPLLEGRIHNMNRHLRLKGEWFNMTVEQAVGEIKHAMILGEDHYSYIR